ncbi:uridine kinase [Clostridium botulinum]|uniref:Uridine kinase n=1 Tax=Clostridium botulinum (strain Okra / Type B1) TaxID=498213 RepID=URK_CLOBK|nr:uridine kinase [Clostridium botulinum]B1IJ68.1 RecName: Full=Uridine kinase; AltName: Full=Cytidine monophosphokinase; AltName: Full=Uridine monophosphokinase [Clostridium botulinum B1 str. Okra]ACA45777.1 uridine kinase [Clostridium botulinum B1 str. Okra]MBD5563331.1 uridine kinase [Clostridium botulinum]MBD5566993.1 uridine kinase [Clostridium botulinum]MBD5570394.1 uridine kinase [Clostridium botulinum]MBD5573892.1 uridine kinase [Clostridium botulinum]
MKRPVLIGITGGTGSGKSTVAKEIYNKFDEACIAMIEQDSYYKDQSSIPFEERCKKNYDHPDAFDNELLINHLKNLVDLNVIEKPIYDFEAHNRKEETIKVEPRDIIIVEGILVLQDPKVRELLDIKIYVDTDADVRIIRRLLRDINERGRTVDSVINQYLTVVRPMHMQFIEPSKRYADIIIPEGGHNRVAVDMMVANIKHLLQK